MENIIELIDHGANVNHVAADDFLAVEGHVFRKTPLFRARSYDIIRLLISMGAYPGQKASKCIRKKINPPLNNGNTSKVSIKNIVGPPIVEHEIGLPLMESEMNHDNISAIQHLMQFHPDCPRAILDSCLGKQDDNIVMDFNVFDDEDDEMSVFNAAERNRRKELFLHPLLQIFLSLKWHGIKPIFWLKILFQIILVIVLTLVGIQYVEVTHCSQEFKDFPNCFRSTYKTDMVICHSKENNNTSYQMEELQNCYNNETYLTEEDYCSINGTKLKPKDEVNIRCIKVYIFQ